MTSRAYGNETPDMWVNVDPTLDFWDPRPKELLAYWQAKRGPRRMPRRQDIDPIELRQHVGNLARKIHEKVPPSPHNPL